MDPLFYRLSALRDKLRSLKIPQNIPNLGWHFTEVPPFLATEQEIDWFSLGVSVGEFFKGSPRMTKTTYIDIFENETEDAVVVRLETDRKFKELIERIRIKIHKITDLKYPPINFEANFHATIAQGKGLSKCIKDAGGIPAVFPDFAHQITTGIPYPTILQKHNGYWAPIMS